MYKPFIHPNFSIHGRAISFDDLTEVSYSLIKEGEDYEKQIGAFLLDWIDDSEIILVKTSGSTGKPKTIALQKEYMVNSALATGSYF
ncbi:MAG: O-succinylbenzoic acid--CoA ligase, partial [Maribacter dokdonensis]